MNEQQKTSVIIENGKNLPFVIRLRDVVLTILMWFLYVYFMKDFFGFLVDVWNWGLSGFVNTGDYSSFKVAGTILSYMEIVVAIGVVFMAWSFYNQVRFRYNNRRRYVPKVSDKQVGEVFEVKPNDLKRLRKSRSIILTHDAEGRLTEIQTSEG